MLASLSKLNVQSSTLDVAATSTAAWHGPGARARERRELTWHTVLWAVLFPNGARAFPFTKVRKQLEAGLEGGDSIVGFYRVAIDYVATGKLGEPSP